MKKIARLPADDDDSDRRHRSGGPLDRSPPGLQNPRAEPGATLAALDDLGWQRCSAGRDSIRPT